ncbi:hypothetical protein AAFF_G00230030 [Aldrovandia affinis]|uniref:Uncharacterized protein n=1 Tax=Aldrovandia affinis TaxID=143900 RepID=A0AAD7WUD6_9TELE|nr:hypothetical protein AAFF_G00230030 [Aldrovandia affinis]
MSHQINLRYREKKSIKFPPLPSAGFPYNQLSVMLFKGSTEGLSPPAVRRERGKRDGERKRSGADYPLPSPLRAPLRSRSPARPDLRGPAGSSVRNRGNG